METIGFAMLFGALIAHLANTPMDNITFLGVCIGLGLCAIARAIRINKEKKE